MEEKGLSFSFSFSLCPFPEWSQFIKRRGKQIIKLGFYEMRFFLEKWKHSADTTCESNFAKAIAKRSIDTLNIC